jgi:hypothetical protein
MSWFSFSRAGSPRLTLHGRWVPPRAISIPGPHWRPSPSMRYSFPRMTAWGLVFPSDGGNMAS